MKDYQTVDVRHLKSTGVDLIKAMNKKCEQAVAKVQIWAPETVPSSLLVTPDQFTIMSTLQGDPKAIPKGKEMFKTSHGYVFEIRVQEV